ncbi:hypothetical protein Dimus_019406 [Dionaea muscipula]
MRAKQGDGTMQKVSSRVKVLGRRGGRVGQKVSGIKEEEEVAGRVKVSDRRGGGGLDEDIGQKRRCQAGRWCRVEEGAGQDELGDGTRQRVPDRTEGVGQGKDAKQGCSEIGPDRELDRRGERKGEKEMK